MSVSSLNRKSFKCARAEKKIDPETSFLDARITDMIVKDTIDGHAMIVSNTME